MNTMMPASAAFKQKRRFYTVLPLLVCPLLVLFFWLLGGGSAVAAGTPAMKTAGGLNLTLPSAKLKDISRLTKMDYYRQADQDSAKRHTLAKNDPYYRLPGLSRASDSFSALTAMVPVKHPRAPSRILPAVPRLHDSDRNEALVYRKLAALNRTLAQRAPAAPPRSLPSTTTGPPSPDVARLEHLVQTLHNRDTSVDPDLQQLGGLLDKIMLIQHPPLPDPPPPGGPIADRPPLKPTGVSPVVALPDTVAVSSETASDSSMADENGFYSPEDAELATPAGGSISAVVDETVTITTGSTVPFRLLEDVRVKSQVIPTSSLVYGTVQLSGDRLSVAIRSVQYRGNIVPVSLAVYSTDGLPGIAAPASVTQDVAKQSADASIQSMGLTSFDQSIGAQATAAGIQAAKTLLSKKVRLVTVTLPAGYQVFLKDNISH